MLLSCDLASGGPKDQIGISCAENVKFINSQELKIQHIINLLENKEEFKKHIDFNSQSEEKYIYPYINTFKFGQVTCSF